MSSRAPVGYLALAALPVAVNQGFIAMQCDAEVSSYFALNWCEANLKQIQARASGTTFPEISKAAFRALPFLLPPLALIRVFDDFASTLYAQVELLARGGASLTDIRDQLLPRLMSGASTVDPDTES